MNKWIKLIQQRTVISGFNNRNSCISEWMILEIFNYALASRNPQLCLTEIQAFKNTFCISLSHFPWASLLSQMVRNPPAVLETQVWSLDQEDPLEKGMATCSSILSWRIPWTEDFSGCSPWGCTESNTAERLTLSLPFLSSHFPLFILWQEFFKTALLKWINKIKQLYWGITCILYNSPIVSVPFNNIL